MMTEKINCSFCMKSQDDVAVIVAAPFATAAICDECIEQCVGIVITAARTNYQKLEAVKNATKELLK